MTKTDERYILEYSADGKPWSESTGYATLEEAFAAYQRGSKLYGAQHYRITEAPEIQHPGPRYEYKTIKRTINPFTPYYADGTYYSFEDALNHYGNEGWTFVRVGPGNELVFEREIVEDEPEVGAERGIPGHSFHYGHSTASAPYRATCDCGEWYSADWESLTKWMETHLQQMKAKYGASHK